MKPAHRFGTTPKIVFALTILVLALPPFARSADRLRILHTFSGVSDGANPAANIVPDGKGNYYGTTQGGAVGFGTVFKLTPTTKGWQLSTIYSFTGFTDGAAPFSLTLDAAGNLYGQTSSGGSCTGFADGCGTVFRLTHTSSGWQKTILYAFSGPDGNNPQAGVVLDSQGNLYGTTANGGITTGICANIGKPIGCGVFFVLSPTSAGTWQQTFLYQFTGAVDGAIPASDLTFDSSGNIYGTTVEGLGGTVFEFSPTTTGWSETVLYSFLGGSDGLFPEAPVRFDSAGNLYGTTVEGGLAGCNVQGCGTVFELTPAAGGGWTKTTIYQFSGIDGSFPQGGVSPDQTGNVYGVASRGGTKLGGVAFELSPAGGGLWTQTILYDFNQKSGRWPIGTVFLDSSGNVYGVTNLGGPPSCADCGTIFELSPSLTE